MSRWSHLFPNRSIDQRNKRSIIKLREDTIFKNIDFNVLVHRCGGIVVDGSGEVQDSHIYSSVGSLTMAIVYCVDERMYDKSNNIMKQ